jgi:hypothetical protein
MFAFLRHLRERWSNWCGDAEMERAIRQYLSDQGYYGRSAKLRNVRLAAVLRPGWVQIYRFEVSARVATAARTDDHPADVRAHAQPPAAAGDDHPAPAVYHELFGLVREDHRYNQTSVRVFASADQRLELFERWSDGLIQLRGGRGMTSP